MTHPTVEADKMLDVYIFDYFKKRKLSATAEAFLAEAQVSERTPIDAPGGFLFEWWSVFWDMFIARYRSSGSNYSDMPHQLQQMQQMLLQQQILQRQNLGLMNYERPSIPPLNRQTFGTRNMLMNDQGSQFSMTQDMRNLTNPSLLRGNGSWSNQDTNMLPGWPLMGMDMLRNSQQQFQTHQNLNMLINLQNSGGGSGGGGGGGGGGSGGGGSLLNQSRTNPQLFQQLPRIPTTHLPQPEAIVGPTNNQSTRKRKQPMSYTDPPTLAESAPTTPSTHTTADTNTGLIFSNIGKIHMKPFTCLDFSSDGKLISSGCVDKTVVLWCTNFNEPKYMSEEHSDTITDIRFSSKLPRFATCSIDKTVKIWDINNLKKSFRTFIGHSSPIMSLDIHPKKEDLVCSSDKDNAIRYWIIKDSGCAGVSKGGAIQVRFQPSSGKYLAALTKNGVSMIDVDTTRTFRYPYQCNKKVESMCWNSTGEYIACLSEDMIRVWKIGSGEKKECIHELCLDGKKLNCCVFYPNDPSLMVIGLEQSLEIWHMIENKMMRIDEDRVCGLIASQRSGVIGSASDDSSVKLWKSFPKI